MGEIGEILIQLVGAGYPGLVVAILLLGFCLSRQALKDGPDANGDPEAAERKRINLRHIRTFWFVSLAFLIVGISAETWRLDLELDAEARKAQAAIQSAQVNVTVSPREMPEMVESPALVAGSEVFPITGRPLSVTVEDRQSLLFQVDGLCQKIHDLDAHIRELIADQGEESHDLGI